MSAEKPKATALQRQRPLRGGEPLRLEPRWRRQIPIFYRPKDSRRRKSVPTTANASARIAGSFTLHDRPSETPSLASERSPVSSLDLPKRASSPHGKEICSAREGWRVLASGAGGIAASCTKRVSSGMLRTRHALNLCTKRNELYLHEAGCVHDMTRWWFRMAVVVPDHAANNFIVLLLPRGQASLPFRRTLLFHHLPPDRHTFWLTGDHGCRNGPFNAQGCSGRSSKLGIGRSLWILKL